MVLFCKSQCREALWTWVVRWVATEGREAPEGLDRDGEGTVVTWGVEEDTVAEATLILTLQRTNAVY